MLRPQPPPQRRRRACRAAALVACVAGGISATGPSAAAVAAEPRARVASSGPMVRSAVRASAASAPWPEDGWPLASAESQGMAPTRLRAVPEGIGAALVIRNGYRVYEWGDPDAPAWWASVSRSFVTTAYGLLIQDRIIKGGVGRVEESVATLRSATARGLAPNVSLKHLLSYTACSSPPGTEWQYSCLWIELNRIVGELARTSIDTFVERALLDRLGGGMSADVHTDGTLRVLGSPADLARWGYLWLRGGRWKGERLVSPRFVRLSTRPLGRSRGQGFVERGEGWQIHLNRERVWAGCPKDAYAAIGGDGNAIVLVVPSRDLVVARSGDIARGDDHDATISRFLGPICRAAS